MHWERPILTDSGGFQVFSLAELRKISEEGVRFASPIDGSPVRLTPEDSMDVQRALGSDIAMCFDDCTAWPATEAQARESMERSMRWAARSKAHYYRGRGSRRGELFGIIQGGMYLPLRQASLEALMQHRLSRARRRRARGGRARGGAAGGAGGHRAADAGRPAALPDGRGPAGGHASPRWRAAWTCSTA